MGSIWEVIESSSGQLSFGRQSTSDVIRLRRVWKKTGAKRVSELTVKSSDLSRLFRRVDDNEWYK